MGEQIELMTDYVVSIVYLRISVWANRSSLRLTGRCSVSTHTGMGEQIQIQLKIDCGQYSAATSTSEQIQLKTLMVVSTVHLHIPVLMNTSR